MVDWFVCLIDNNHKYDVVDHGGDLVINKIIVS